MKRQSTSSTRTSTINVHQFFNGSIQAIKHLQLEKPLLWHSVQCGIHDWLFPKSPWTVVSWTTPPKHMFFPLPSLSPFKRFAHERNCGRNSPSWICCNMTPHWRLQMDVQSTPDAPSHVIPCDSLPAHVDFTMIVSRPKVSYNLDQVTFPFPRFSSPFLQPRFWSSFSNKLFFVFHPFVDCVQCGTNPFQKCLIHRIGAFLCHA